MADENENKNFKVGLSVGGIILVLSLCVAVGQHLSMIENNSDHISEIRQDVKSIRAYIDQRTADRHTTADAARDMDYINRRLEQLERRLNKIEDRKL